MSKHLFVRRLAALAAAMLLLFPARAGAQSPRRHDTVWALLSQAGLVGIWSPHCDAPANYKNLYVEFLESPDGIAEKKVFYGGPDTQIRRNNFSVDIIRDVRSTATGELLVTTLPVKVGGVLGTVSTTGTLQVEHGRFRWMTSIRSDGRVLISQGVLVPTGAPVPWYGRCGPASAQAVELLAQ